MTSSYVYNVPNPQPGLVEGCQLHVFAWKRSFWRKKGSVFGWCALSLSPVKWKRIMYSLIKGYISRLGSFLQVTVGLSPNLVARCCWTSSLVEHRLIYSFIFFCLISSRAEEDQDSAFTEEAVHSGQLKAKRAGFRSARSKSESSAAHADGNTTRYLSWENVSFLGQELRKTVSRGFQWIASPSLGKIQNLKVASSY